MALCVGGVVFAAPLEGGHPTAEEQAAASREARYSVIAAAGKYEKTPYRYGGLDRNGLDCSGLIYASFKDALGVSVPRTTGALYVWAEKIPNEKAQPGDLLFFKTDNTGKISHAAIYLGNGRFIHSASAGPATGVIYSGLDERYWARSYAGAGRALPEGDLEYQPVIAGVAGTAGAASSGGGEAGGGGSAGNAGSAVAGTAGGWAAVRPDVPDKGNAAGEKAAEEKKPHLLLGIAAAPTWNGFLKGGDLVRGFAGQLRLGAETYTFGKPMIFGLEVRPEYDGALGVFRLPVTLSWGPSDKFLIFAGPAFSFGDARLVTEGGERRYTGGTSWLGAVGFTAAPFLFAVGSGELAPYVEAAWQSYFRSNTGAEANADFSAGFRFSTGIRYTWKL
jgi:probable lipoprotein NlpC